MIEKDKRSLKQIKKERSKPRKNMCKCVTENSFVRVELPQKKENIETFSKNLLINMECDRSISDIILANLIMLTAVFISTFIPVFSVALPILVLLYFEVGLMGFIYKKEMQQNYSYEDLFVSIKKYIKIFCTAVIKLFIVLFGFVLFIIPGVLFWLNYIFTGIILFESPDLDVKGALMLSKELSYGYRWNIFYYHLLALTSICVAVSFSFFLLMLFDIFLVVPITVYIVIIVMSAILALVLMAMPMVEVAIIDNYILAKQRKTQTNEI